MNATIKQTKKKGLYRKPSPKRTRQKRRIALPSFTAAAVRSQGSHGRAGERGVPVRDEERQALSVSNYERLLRSFVDENKAALKRRDRHGSVQHPYLPSVYRDARGSRRRHHTRIPYLGTRTNRSPAPATSSAPNWSTP